MVEAIDKKYCIGDFVQLMAYTDACQLIVSNDEIILLKIGDRVLVNKYANHPNRNLFPYHEKEKNDWNHFTELFEYNKIYLNYGGSVGGSSINKWYFTKDNERALFIDEFLSIDASRKEKIVELTREEIEEIFNSNNYDAMYVMNKNGILKFARNDKDEIHIGKNIIPSDEEIINMELESRKVDCKITSRILNPEKEVPKNILPKTIDEIQDLNIYGPVFSANYSDVLLTVKDGKFDLKCFKIDFVEKDKFRLTTSTIDIKEPTDKEISKYSKKHDIRYTIDPNPSTKKTNNLEENQNNQEVKEEKGLKKSLKRIFNAKLND